MMGCIVGCRPPATGLFLVPERLINAWRRNGGRVLRKAVESDGTTETKWIPLRTAQQAHRSGAAQPVAQTPAPIVVPDAPRKRGRPRKTGDT